MNLKRKIAGLLAALMVLTLGGMTTFADSYDDGIVEEDVDTGIRYVASSTDSTQPYCVIKGEAVKDTDASATKALAYKPKTAKNQATGLDYRLGESTSLHISQTNMATIAKRNGYITADFDGGYAVLNDVTGSKSFDFTISQKDNAKVTAKLKALGFDGKADQFAVGGTGNFPGALTARYVVSYGENYTDVCERYTYYYNPLTDSFEYISNGSSYTDEISIYLSWVKSAGTYIVTDKQIKDAVEKKEPINADEYIDNEDFEKDVTDNINGMQKGETLEIATGDSGYTISNAIIKEAKSKGVNLSVYSPDNNAVFKFTNYDTVDKMSGSFNPNVKIGKNIVKDIDKTIASNDKTRDVSYVTVSFDYDGMLPGKTEVTLDVSDGGFTDGATVYLYYFNEKTSKFELVGESTYNGGFAAFELEHCSDYIVTSQKLDETITEPKGTATVETSKPSAPRANAPKATAKASTPKTGDTTPIIPLVVVLVAGLAVITVVCTRKKRA